MSTNSYYQFQLAVRLGNFYNITIKQATCFQVRLTVYYKNAKNQNTLVSPYECFSISNTPKNQGNCSSGQILSDDSYLSPKFLMNGINKSVAINSVCIFKGEIPILDKKNKNPEIYVYSQLFWSISKEPELIGDWTGYTKYSCLTSTMEMYFSNHYTTCSIEASIHCLISELKFQSEDQFNETQKAKLYYNIEQNRQANLYDVAIQPLIYSIQELIKWTNQLRDIQKIAEEPPKPKDKSQWKYFRLRRLLQVSSPYRQKQKNTINFPQTINNLQASEYLACIKADAYRISEYLFVYWKYFLGIIQKYPNSLYFKGLKKKYTNQLDQDHWQNHFFLTDDENGKNFNKQIPNQLKFVSSEKYDCQIKLSRKDLQMFMKIKKMETQKEKVIILVHGFQASSFDMQIIGAYFKYRNPNTYIMISQSNEGRTQAPIQQCSHRLAVEVKNFLNTRELKSASISFVGHSLGGLIIRGALKYLQLYKNNFQLFITLCSPHIGYLYHTSKIVTTSMWVMNQVKKDRSMIELTMADNPDLTKTSLYQLSLSSQLSWFKNIILLGSREDQYVPFGSALLIGRQFFYETSSAKIHQTMYNNIMKNIEDKIIRLQLVYKDKIKDLSGFIGRTAHIKVLSYLPIIELYIHLISKLL